MNGFFEKAYVNIDGNNRAENQGALVYTEDSEITLGFVGDIMLDRGVLYKLNKYGGGDFYFPFLRIYEELRKYDILFGNLEGPISDKGINQGSMYSFRMDPRAADALKFAGFDIVSVANNHANDWGHEAYLDTFARLDSAGINYVGGGVNFEEVWKIKIIEKNNLKVAFVAASQFGNPKNLMAVIDGEKIKEALKEAKENADIAVISLHFGDEYKEEPNDYQRKIAEMSVENGADLVIGHHPHVIENLEKYRNSYIAYSLGNFIFDQYFSLETMQGGVLDVKIKNKKIEGATLRTVKLNSMYQPAFVD